MKKIFALIPARSGSKGIRNKNILNFKGKPLIAHSIIQGNECKFIDEVYVSTDSKRYRKIAKQYGAKAPFLRPKEISGDLSTDYEVFSHFLTWLENEGIMLPDVIIHLRPTYPIRRVNEIERMIEYFLKNLSNADSLRTVIKTPHSPFKMWKTKGKYLIPLLKCKNIPEQYNSPRQLLPVVYWQNGCIDIVKTETIIKKKSMTGNKILYYEMNEKELFDIDETSDYQKIKDL